MITDVGEPPSALEALLNARPVDVVVYADAEADLPNKTIAQYTGGRRVRSVVRSRLASLVRELALSADVAIVDSKSFVGPMWIELMRREIYRNPAVDWLAADTVAAPSALAVYGNAVPGGFLAWPEIVRYRAMHPTQPLGSNSSAACVYMRAEFATSFETDWLQGDRFLPGRLGENSAPRAGTIEHIATRVIVGTASGGLPRDLDSSTIDAVPPTVLHIGTRPERCAKEKRGYFTHRCIELSLDGEVPTLRHYDLTSSVPQVIGRWDGNDLAKADLGRVADWLDPHSIEVAHQCVAAHSQDVAESVARACGILGIPLLATAPRLVELEGSAQAARVHAAEAPPTDRASRIVREATYVTVPSELEKELTAALVPQLEPKLIVLNNQHTLPPEWSSWRSEPVRPAGPLRVLIRPEELTPAGSRDAEHLIRSTGDWVEWHAIGPFPLEEGKVIEHPIIEPAPARLVLKSIQPDLVYVDASDTSQLLESCSRAGSYGLPLVAISQGLPPRLSPISNELLIAKPAEELTIWLRTRSRILGESGWQAPPMAYAHESTSHSVWAMTIARLTGAVKGPVIGYVVHDRWGDHPGSAHVRVLRRAQCVNASREAIVIQINPHALALGLDHTDYDAIVVQRDAVPPSALSRFLNTVASRNIRLVLELDDDLMTPAARERLTRTGYASDALDGVRTIADAADAMIVSTQTLATTIQRLGVPLAVIPNEIDRRIWRPVNEAPGNGNTPVVRVLYMGSATHDEDIQLLSPIFANPLMTSDGIPVELEVLGITRDDEAWFNRIAFPPSLNQYPDFVEWLRANRDRWDIAVAPLVDTPFNRSKSDLKFLEYSMLGLPTIASDVGPYRDIAEHGGIVVSNEPASWRAAILQLASSPAQRALISRHSLEYVTSSRSLQSGNELDPWRSVVMGAAV